jgi:hypothetical protein
MSEFSVVIAIKCPYCEKQLCRTFQPETSTQLIKTCSECGAQWLITINPEKKTVYATDRTGNLEPSHELYEIVEDDDDTACEMG